MRNSIDICDEIKKFNNLTIRFMHQNKLAYNTEKLTRTQGLVLAFIYDNLKENKKVYQKDIESNFSIRKSTATESLKKLEIKGYIYRNKTSSDARLKEITLTEKAIENIKKIEKQKEFFSNIVNKGISLDEKIELKKIITKLKNNLLKELNHEENI